MILSKCAICSSKKSRFIKEQEAKLLLSNLGIRTPLSKIGRCFVLSAILLIAITMSVTPLKKFERIMYKK